MTKIPSEMVVPAFCGKQLMHHGFVQGNCYFRVGERYEVRKRCKGCPLNERMSMTLEEMRDLPPISPSFKTWNW